MSETAMNPFTGQAAAATSIPMPEFLRDWGFRLQESMLDAAKTVTDGTEGNLSTVMIAVGIAVVFGIIHIIGPGHGKLFTIGYFGSRRAKLREGLWLSALVNILDSISALLLVGIAYGILSLSLRSAGISAGRITKLIAYGSITLLSGSHLLWHLFHRRHHHAEETQHEIKEEASPKGMKGWMLALSVGLIPCPVSSAILAWGIVNSALGFSILLVGAVSFGGMIAMTAFSFLLIGGKRSLTGLLEKRGLDRALSIFELASMGFLTLVGVLLFLSVI